MNKPKRVQTEDGQDITEGVQILYDIAHSSMDWGSGFLDNSEMETVISLAVTMGWQVPDLPYSTSERSPTGSRMSSSSPSTCFSVRTPNGREAEAKRPSPSKI